MNPSGANEHFSRTALLTGTEGLERLKNASVALAGVGGVGSYAAEALARAGVGNITVIDSDVIHRSNINRQLHALTNTVGRPKVEVMAERISLINPDINLTPLHMTISPENIEPLLAVRFDIVLDAIDTLDAKLALLVACHKDAQPVISSMGAAGRIDPSRVKVADISESKGCRLARKLRKLLRGKGIERGIKVVYSDEPFDINSIGPRDDSFDSRRSLGSISYMPAIFGMTLAGVAIRILLDNETKKIRYSS